MTHPNPPYPTGQPRLSIKTAAATGAEELGHIVLTRYREASMFRNSPASGPNGRSAAANLTECRKLHQGLLSPEQEAISADVAGVKINMIRTKAAVLTGWLQDITNANVDKLLTVEPTPNPNLSATGKEALRQSVWESLTAKLKEQGYPADEASLELMPAAVRDEVKAWLAMAAQDLKKQAHAKELAIATDAAKAMQRLISDQLVEADFRTEYGHFLQDFATRPFAVMKSPTLEQVMKPGWVGDVWGKRNAQRVGVRRVNPFDFFFSPDSTTTQNGSYVIERIATRRDQLVQMAKSPNWIKENVIAALDHFHSGGPLDWLGDVGATNDAVSKASSSGTHTHAHWSHGETVVRLQMHGLFSGRELARFGVGAGMDPNEFAEAVITTLGNHVIQARLQVVPLAGQRPYHSTSFQPSADHAIGLGLPNLMADIQISAYSAFWAMTRNAALSSGARGEVDFSRLKGFLPENCTPEQVLSQPFHFVEPDMARTSGGAPAFKFATIPNNTSQFITLLHELDKRADDESGIPSIVGGELQQATVGRAFRSVATLFGAASRQLKAKLGNIDKDVLGPIGDSLYAYNMTHELENHPEFLNLDAECIARGTSGLLAEEMKNQAAVEALAAAPGLVQLAQAGGTNLPAGLVNAIIAKAANGMGIDTTAWPELEQDTKFSAAVSKSIISNVGPSSVPKI